MELDERSSLFLKYFQELHFSQKLQNGSPSERADVWRNLLVQIDFANISKLLTNEGANILLDEYRGRYLDIVDDFNEETGLNNFAEGALALCSLHRNESQDWESSFSVNSIMKMNCIQELQKETMTSAKRLLPPGTETSILTPVRKSPADDGDYQFAAQDLSLLQSGSVNKSEHTNGTSVMRSTQWSDSNRCAATLFKNIDPSINDSGPAYLKQKPLFGSVKSQDSSINILPIHESSSLNRKQELLKGSQSDVDMESDDLEGTVTHFRTALDEFNAANLKYGKNKESVSSAAYGSGRKCLGTRRGPSSKFTPPVINKGQREFGFPEQCGPSKTLMLGRCEENTDDRLKGIEPKMVELIMNEIMDHGPSISWNDVAGLEFAKKTIKEIVVWPMLRPDIFTGLRGPPKGLLLFGPPGTGKTLIGKCIASQSKSTFFSISASSLTSKWVGEGEKMVRAMFTVARCHQPVVIFIDEIDSLLSQRSETEHESSRKIKTEFLVQLDGVATESDERILVVGATNRPQEIDEAARRRFVKRLYIPLPEAAARRQIVQNLLCNQKHHLNDEELETLCQKSEGYSGADMTNLCREAALGPIRSISFGEIESIRADQVRPITYCDFQEAFLQVKASVSVRDLEVYMNWNEMYGSGGN